MSRPRLRDLIRRRRTAGPIESFFGDLEFQVLEAVWAQNTDVSVRDLEPEFPETAYTTLMTTLDRLHKKGILGRAKDGRAYRYRPRFTRSGLESYLATDAFVAILETTSSARPLLTSFVDAVSQKDAMLLDELERLVKEKRREQEEDAES